MERLQIIRIEQPKSGTGLILMPPENFRGAKFLESRHPECKRVTEGGETGSGSVRRLPLPL